MAAVLDAFASKLVDILTGMAKDEVEMLLGVPGEITKLEATLGDLSSILADAERSRIRDSAVERWVRELKDVISWSVEKIPRHQFPLRKALQDAGTSPRRSIASATLLSRMKLEGRSKPSTSDWRTLRRGAPASDSSRKKSTPKSDVVGDKIMEDTKKIVDLLTKKVGSPAESKGNNVVVAVAITGMGGIGKTTLARMVFNDSKMEESFDQRIWLSVNKEVNDINALRSVLASFGTNHESFAGNKDLLERALKDTVQQKEEFLLVMDDVWSEKV
ncbi:unnamed protein product [Miscanthus lutarioriparius]|uniref:Uncharacterized protein n=1 Tax=Miscanthus lutarioriparius TaxID=422564 RepID=A0A811MKY2_9POAL|nr:unnamed protein product [Miscanthus lutarioriparius]